jgi:superfamily II DNA or RNA helicase
MLNDIISTKKNQWLQSPDCTIIGLIGHIKSADKLRTPQIEAIETYLFLKIAGENKPLWQLFSEGFFNQVIDLNALNINQIARDYFLQNTNALALYQFAARANLQKLVASIVENPSALDYDLIIKSLFYNVSYPDYLLSLPMGAGKTYLMAAFMYLDLYFAELEPNNKHFAHNFLVLIPSGLKSSIVPSLKTIQHFQPSWVLPEPAASHLKSLLKFDVLDESKAAKKSNKANNPNAQKVNNVLPNPFGQVFVVNAEKVILERVELNPTLSTVEKTDDEKSRFANELRHLIGEIPNLSILIDEVHHAATDDIKLRRVVTDWHAEGNITTVLGFSGTPYLQKADTINIASVSLKLTEISNTVYYYPLIEAVKTFLKKPKVQTGKNLNRLEIIKHGVQEFDALYCNKIYTNGTIPKLAIYCISIDDLYENILPFLTSELAVNRDEILEFHGGNKNYPIAKENELAFRSLDLPHSKHRYILLVQIGKEGWDCPSLTGVILSQKGNSAQNMVLQTACRCLRQVDSGGHETALIWLNQDNADTLNKQLQQEQHITIDDLNAVKGGETTAKIERVSRLEQLQLPPLEFHQLKVTYQVTDIEDDANTHEKLSTLLAEIDNYKRIASTTTDTIDSIGEGSTRFINEEGEQVASYKQWLFDIVRGSFKTLSRQQLNAFDADIRKVFECVTYQKNGQHFFNDLYHLPRIESQIRLSFARQRELQTETEIIPKTAQLLLVEKLTPVNDSAGLYPNKIDSAKILEFDANNKPLEIDLAEKQRAYDAMKQSMEVQGFAQFLPTFDAFQTGFEISDIVKRKDQSFHYLPYDFGASGASGFEFDLFKRALSDSDFQNKANALEIYYNGERGLTEFVIDCFAKNGKYWKNIGHYTPDFLMIRRDDANKIHKVLIIETKGGVYAEKFKPRKTFMEAEFLRVNNEKYGYARFDFLYLEDSQKIEANTAKLNAKINQFFNNESCQ